MNFLPTTADYICRACGQSMAENQDRGFICRCGGTFVLASNLFAIHGLEWDYMTKGYHPERDDPAGEVRHDMKVMEQNLSYNVHNLKDYRRGMKALKTFGKANRRVLK